MKVTSHHMHSDSKKRYSSCLVALLFADGDISIEGALSEPANFRLVLV